MSKKTLGLPTRYFKLLKGRHYGIDEVLYIAKDPKRNIIKSEDDLCAKFKNKFEEVTERMAYQNQMLKEDVEQAIASLGKDVTEKYPLAAKGGLRVFRDANKKYHIVDAEGIQHRPLNKTPLNKESVKDFLALQTA